MRLAWFESGALRSRTTFEHGSEEGLCEEFREDGSVFARGDHHAGVRTGTWRFFDADGALDLERSGLYVAGERVSASDAARALE